MPPVARFMPRVGIENVTQVTGVTGVCARIPAQTRLTGSRGELCHPYLHDVILTYQYRLLPSKQQHRALESLLESQR